MFTRTLARRAALAGATVTAALVLAACGGDHSTSGSGRDVPGMGGTGTPAPGASASFGDADVMFAQMMIPHHQQAVQMAELAESRAADPELKRLAAQIKGAQAPEITTMSGWLTAWGRPVPSASAGHGMPEMDHGMPGMMSDADMTKLAAASGTDFDRQFLTMMIAHHEGAITMAKDELAQGANPDAKALAQRIVAAQQGEIDTMRKMLDRL
ncbi:MULTISPECIES: DUF305 domain-containing protein [Micromonospora]|uniref:DUF305 domain-containing protein n=1 Tax=Micromonospora solifontis TaxID=2487138 RepID=A0ABX9WLT9_9ACTN|nr:MULTISPECIES: DUF305 domain-containing protein [Micromonospora]NES14794.1 DUF305 domain-containing protein [Micromonospora sp. PPF5-17B]NES35358.1 DUF305 domain-containing protein [Micromonospora solifontis]NES56160.1 DUF305 domain-containing protein [Micromonospora sp. PPF5-6]RNM00853.1 DUF305 domain-containing protein [Micromonospora solifontis]